MKNIFIVVIIGLILFGCKSVTNTTTPNKKTDGFSVAFYNVENLFDVEDDPKTSDNEYTPNSDKKWTTDRYNTKLDHISKVFDAMPGVIPDLIGFAEIENRRVLEDLNNSELMSSTNYSIVTKDGYDQRGIDVALLYNPEKFELINQEYYRPKDFNGKPLSSRFILHAELKINGEVLHVYVNHWPSRGGDYEKKKLQRHAVANRLKNEINKVLAKDADANIIIMGDFNDYPTNKSIKVVLEAGVSDNDTFYNLMWDLENDDKGSYCYKKDWGCLDQFIVSKNFISGKGKMSTSENQVEIFQKEFMMYTNKKGESYPSRTYSRDKYFGGYSDHLPIFMQIEMK